MFKAELGLNIAMRFSPIIKRIALKQQNPIHLARVRFQATLNHFCSSSKGCEKECFASGSIFFNKSTYLYTNSVWYVKKKQIADKNEMPIC